MQVAFFILQVIIVIGISEVHLYTFVVMWRYFMYFFYIYTFIYSKMIIFAT